MKSLPKKNILFQLKDEPMIYRQILVVLGILGMGSGLLMRQFLSNAYFPAYIYLSTSGICLAIAILSYWVPHIRRNLFDYASFCYLFMYLGLVFITYLNNFEIHFTLILLAAHVFFAISFRSFIEYFIFAIASLILLGLCFYLATRLALNQYLLLSVFTILTLFAGMKVWLSERNFRRINNGGYMLTDLFNSSQSAIFLLDANCKNLLYLNTTSQKYLQVLTGQPNTDADQLFNLLGIDPAFIISRFRTAPYSLQEKGFCTIESTQGREIYFELYISKVRAIDGDNIFVKLLDITEHRRRERHLQRSISVNESLVHAIPDLLIRVDINGIIQFVRAAGILPSLHIAESFVGQHFMQVIRKITPPNIHSDVVHLFEATKADGGVQQMELEVPRSRKSRFYDLRLVRLEEEEEVLAIVREITDSKEVELALKQSEQNYREIFNSSKDGIILADLNTHLPIDVSRATYEILGYNVEEFSLLPVHSLCKQADAAKLAFAIREAKEGNPQTLTCQFIRKDERLVWADVSVKSAEIGGRSRIMLIIRDIEERIEFTQKIQRYADLFESVDIGMIVMHLDESENDGSFRFISCNAFAENLLGVKSKDITDRFIDDVIPRWRPHGVPQRMLKAINKGEILFEDELLYPDKNNDLQFWQIKATPLSGSYIGVLVEIVTERKKATERLKYQALLADSVSDAIISTRPDFTIESWNQAAQDIYGWKEDELIGKNLTNIFKGIFVNTSRKLAIKTLMQKGFWEGEIIQERKDGEKITVLSSASIITDDKGEPSRIVILNRDISAQKERELIIKKSEQKFRDLFNSSPEAILVTGMDGMILNANTSACELYTMTQDELIGQRSIDLVPEIYRDWVQQQYQDLVQGNINYVESFIQSNKHGEIPVEIRAGRINLEGRPAMLFHITNIQERLKSEAALRQSEQKYRTLVEKMNEGLVLTDSEENTLFVNNSMCKILGLSKEEMIGRKTYEYLSGGEEDIEKLQRELLKNQGLFNQYELQIKRKNGDTIWVLVTGAPYTDSDGTVMGTIAIITNITDRKITELKLKDSNNELDAFVYKASHDLKGPLASIIGLTNIAKDEIRDERALEYFEMIRKSTSRLDTILLDLIDVTRINKATLESRPVKLPKLIDDVINSLKHQPQSEHIRFNVNLNGVDSFVSDSKLLTSIFQNLIGNSINYHDPNKDESFIEINAQQTPQGLTFQVMDNGLGIPKRLQSKVFEMFYRGNTRSKGSGLGLYIVKNSIEKLQGTCKLESEEGVGTIFSFHLPYLQRLHSSASKTVEVME